jgi:hypothetical protein
MTTNQFLLSDVGSDATGQTKTFVNLHDDVIAPKGAVSLSISTVYNKARNPDAHISKLALTVGSKDKLRELGQFLIDFANA